MCTEIVALLYSSQPNGACLSEAAHSECRSDSDTIITGLLPVMFVPMRATLLRRCKVTLNNIRIFPLISSKTTSELASGVLPRIQTTDDWH